MNTPKNKARRALVIDCDVKYLVALRHLLMAMKGLRVGILLIRPEDTLAGVATRIRCFKPDILVASEKYFSFWASDVLKAIGSPFYVPKPPRAKGAPSEEENPRLVFTSMFPSKEILAISGAHFKRKYDLVRGDRALESEAEAILVDIVSSSLRRIG